MSDTIDDQVQRAFETLAERVHTAVTDHVRAAAGQLSASVAADRQAAAAAHDAAGRRIAEDTERNVTATLREAFARRESERLNRLLRGVRALDAASSLSQALDILADIATDEAPRMVLFLVRADGLRAWSHAGFDALLGTAAFELSLADAGVAGEAVRQMTPQRAGADKEGRPAFAQDRAAGTFAAVPLS
ncbi:MAG TPA: hypothetical protein VF488_00140, partial [Gemmatimonadaceae bacterium]